MTDMDFYKQPMVTQRFEMTTSYHTSRRQHTLTYVSSAKEKRLLRAQFHNQIDILPSKAILIYKNRKRAFNQTLTNTLKMDPAVIPLILKEIDLDDKSVANIYQHGSWVYGTNTANSDWDLIIVARLPAQKPIQFQAELDYFHEFVLHRLWNQYDVCVYSVENFETLLRVNYLDAVQCLFLPDQFKIREEIDFRSIYLAKYYNPLRIKRVAAYEMAKDLNLYYSRDQSLILNHPSCSSRRLQTDQQRKDYIFKNLFHGIRYLSFATQLIEAKSIYNFTSVTPLFHQMRKIRGHPSSSAGLDRVAEFIWKKSLEYKVKFEALLPGNTVKGPFEVYITFARTKDALDRLRAACENSRYQPLFNDWTTSQPRDASQQLVVSASYEGECPAVIQQIESEAHGHFENFQIVRIKIESSARNEGVPLYDFEKQILWNDETNYFSLQLTFPLDEKYQEKVRSLRKICGSMLPALNSTSSPRVISKHTRIEDDQFLLSVGLFDVGQTNALAYSNAIVRCFKGKGFKPSNVCCKFIVYDTNVRLEQD